MWLRVADPDWDDPLDPSWAGRAGRRWNPPGAFPALYLNADVETARLQLERMLEGMPVEVDDLADDAFVLVAATLPRDQPVADTVGDDGLVAVGLPTTYPADDDGRRTPKETCQAIGLRVHDMGLRGVLCRSAATLDGRGTELAWFPATTRSAGHRVWVHGRPLGDWRHATRWDDLDLPEQEPMR